MITWLFTQVWLWSLASFALGVLINWLLFVRPLRRRLAEVTAAYPEGEYEDYEYDQAGGYDDRAYGEAPLDLVRPAPPRWDVADEPTIGDWERPPRAWTTPDQRPNAQQETDNTWFRKSAEEAARSEAAAPVNSAVTTVRPQTPPAAEPQPVAPPAEQWPKAEAAETTKSSQAPAKSAEEVVAAIAAEAAAESAKAAPEQATPSETAEAAERADAGESRISGLLHGADDATESRLSGQLRSLFESVETPGEGKAAETPYVPPVGADATQVIPKVEDGSPDAPPLPRRTPGAGPRPGREASSGPMIKGHSASRQYHSPESPQYDDIVADVWFRTASDAEIAGFQPWNGQRAT
ncbi:hypothetical protein MOQ72_06480 [Saccharopolyspora sp. K220]|uniref:sunset domain-containing protein n=1 Tax=Saccharopolyspora soli TaxID=2926618 RepID=UPI001F5889DE|nr:hypothetical protein [Saccharopolyspora soli]MCI2417065.1 hypothetical protein [Saccharopolyspora soli]